MDLDEGIIVRWVAASPDRAWRLSGANTDCLTPLKRLVF